MKIQSTTELKFFADGRTSLVKYDSGKVTDKGTYCK